jgi:uncharacterized protein with NRDE domain
MCTVVVLRRPDHDWPLILGANRDEMIDRPWRAPGRHWPDRENVTAGYDELAGGSWMGLNDQGVTAAVLNRVGTLGPAEDKRSRGELVLEALDHADAADAATALAHLDPEAYRPFNLLVADNRDAFWLAHLGDGRPIATKPLAEGVSMLTARDLNDPTDPRIRRYLKHFQWVEPPDPAADSWHSWEELLTSDAHEPAAGPLGAMRIRTAGRFNTVSSSLLALPAPAAEPVRPIWRFAVFGADATRWEPIQGLH